MDLNIKNEDYFRKIIVLDVGVRVYQKKLAGGRNATSKSIENGKIPERT